MKLAAATAATVGLLVAAPAAAAPGLDASLSSASKAGGPTASASAETLISYAGKKKKLRIRKRMPYPIVCAVICNARSVSFIVGPRTKLKVVVSGTIPALTPVAVILKPNGPLQKRFRAFPGKFKIKTKIVATDPATGDRDVDKRNYRIKR